jgi:hypothetical protein
MNGGFLHSIHDGIAKDRVGQRGWISCDLYVTGLDVKQWKSLSLNALAVGRGS